MSILRLLPSPLESRLSDSKDPEAVLRKADELAAMARAEENWAKEWARLGKSDLAKAARMKAGNFRSRSAFLMRYAKRLVDGM